jgi:hypothetical protein
MAHGQIVVLDRAIAGDFSRTVLPSGNWNPGGVTATEPGAGGAEVCGAGALQAASPRETARSEAARNGTSVFIDFWAPGERLEASILDAANASSITLEPVTRLGLERIASFASDPPDQTDLIVPLSLRDDGRPRSRKSRTTRQ